MEETGLSENCMKAQQVETDKTAKSRQTRQPSPDQHDNALMLGKGNSDERF